MRNVPSGSTSVCRTVPTMVTVAPIAGLSGAICATPAMLPGRCSGRMLCADDGTIATAVTIAMITRRAANAFNNSRNLYRIGATEIGALDWGLGAWGQVLRTFGPLDRFGRAHSCQIRPGT